MDRAKTLIKHTHVSQSLEIYIKQKYDSKICPLQILFISPVKQLKKNIMQGLSIGHKLFVTIFTKVFILRSS